MVDAVQPGFFQVYAHRTIDEGVLLTWVLSGARNAGGSYPEGTVNALADQRLRELAQGIQAFTGRDGVTQEVPGSGRTEAVDLGLPDELPFLFEAWLQALGSQLTVFPADLRIEAWNHERFPGLRGVQERSLAADVRRAFPLFDPLVVATTPPTIYRPTMAMNAGQAWKVAELYRRPDLLQPFEEHDFVDRGRHLTRLVLEASDDGHRSDPVVVNQWAEGLGLAGWFDWVPYHGSR